MKYSATFCLYTLSKLRVSVKGIRGNFCEWVDKLRSTTPLLEIARRARETAWKNCRTITGLRIPTLQPRINILRDIHGVRTTETNYFASGRIDSPDPARGTNQMLRLTNRRVKGKKYYRRDGGGTKNRRWTVTELEKSTPDTKANESMGIIVIERRCMED